MVGEWFLVPNCRKRLALLRSWINNISAAFGSFGAGAGFAWSSPALPRINEADCQDDCDISGVGDTMSTWIVTIFLIGGIFSGPMAFYLMKVTGRKYTLILFVVPMLIGYILLVLSKVFDNVILLLVGRFLAGKTCDLEDIQYGSMSLCHCSRTQWSSLCSLSSPVYQ